MKKRSAPPVVGGGGSPKASQGSPPVQVRSMTCARKKPARQVQPTKPSEEEQVVDRGSQTSNRQRVKAAKEGLRSVTDFLAGRRGCQLQGPAFQDPQGWAVWQTSLAPSLFARAGAEA